MARSNVQALTFDHTKVLLTWRPPCSFEVLLGGDIMRRTSLLLAACGPGCVAAFASYMLNMCETSVRIEDEPTLMGMPSEADPVRRVRFERADGTVLACGIDSYRRGEELVVAISAVADGADFALVPDPTVDQWADGAQHVYDLAGPGAFHTTGYTVGCDGRRAEGNLDPPSYKSSAEHQRASTRASVTVNGDASGPLAVHAAWAPQCCTVKITEPCVLLPPDDREVEEF
jgi:hypothetical protein